MAGPTSALRTRSRSRARNDENIDPNVGDPQQVNPSAVNVTVAGAGLDIYIPTIPEIRESDIRSKFKVKVLTPLDGRPTYEKMRTLTQELGRNALGIQVPFGGGKRGCLGLVLQRSKIPSRGKCGVDSPRIRGGVPHLRRQRHQR